MDIIQVTNPKFHRQTMRSIIVANARHQIDFAVQMRTLDYHRRNFLAKDERQRKWMHGRLTEMGGIMEASRAREEEQRRARERRRASIYERNELNIDRSVADENAIQMMKKLIQTVTEVTRPPRSAAFRCGHTVAFASRCLTLFSVLEAVLCTTLL